MENKEFYIRYRVYTHRAKKADRNYPRRLGKNLRNLHNTIQEDYEFWNRNLKEDISQKTFIPDNLEHINPAYYNLISNITEYFDCYAIWETTMIKGTTKAINTFTIIGYKQDMLLAYHYITKIINNLNDMRFNMKAEYRRVKINRRRRGENIKEKDNAMVKSSNFFYKSLSNICSVSKEILENRAIYLKSGEKLSHVESYIRGKLNPDFRAYHYNHKPKLKNAFSREGKFQNKRIIR